MSTHQKETTQKLVKNNGLQPLSEEELRDVVGGWLLLPAVQSAREAARPTA